MYTTDYKVSILKKEYRHTSFITLLLIILLSLILFFLLLARKTGQLTGYADVAVAGFILLLVVVYFYISYSRSFRIQITGANDVLQICINDPAFPESLIIKSPFSVRKQWIHLNYADLSKPQLDAFIYLSIMSAEGDPLVTFTAVSKMRDGLHGYEYIDMRNPFEKAQLSKAALVYHTQKTTKIEEELRIYLDFIANRRRSGRIPDDL